MRRACLQFLILVLVFLLSAPAAVPAADKTDQRVKTATEVFSEIMAIPEDKIPPALLNNAQGIAVIPGVIKAGFIVGGRRGRGVLSVRTESGGWSSPAFVTLTGGSIGWQIGVQSTDIILVFKSRKNIETLMKGKFTLGADASVAAGPVGRHTGAGTDIKLQAEIYSYSRSRGLFAGVALEGAALQFDDWAIESFYQSPGLTAKALFSRLSVREPFSAIQFRNTVDRYTVKASAR
jgi:lipid-binding SYLF domain-containing protein